MTTRHRILVVDDHALIRESIRMMLSADPDLEIVGEAGSLGEAVSCVRALSPDLVLTDLSMPDTHGIEAVTELKFHFPRIPILVVSGHRESEIKSRCREAGAAGYVMKHSMHYELLDGICTVLRGKTYLGADAPPEGMAGDHGYARHAAR